MADGQYRLEKLLRADEPLMMRVSRPFKAMMLVTSHEQKISISELVRRAVLIYMERAIGEGFEERYNRAIDEEIKRVRG
jgi:hypothetical protein